MGTTGEHHDHKSSVAGACSNLINAIVGAGIVGIPFAIRETGLVAGVVLVGLVAVLASKSLRLLVETASLVHAPSYETLCEASFGSKGFMFVSIAMFSLAYGSMVTYLMIVKDTLPDLMGLDSTKERRFVLLCVSLLVIVPLSSQRDMADLSKTSRLNVVFDCIMVLLVVWIAPIAENVMEAGGFASLLQESTIHVDTVFVGLGVLSFAFVCQHSAFIISNSLQHKCQWGVVTKISLAVCGTLATLCGMGGYLGYLSETRGNILNNLGKGILPNVARGLLGTTMLFVYPMESFVARHVCVVLMKRIYKNDPTDTAKKRIALTVLLYVAALIPAMLFTDLGKVLAVTGTVGGSSLSYIGPGAAYLGVHGERFMELVVKRYWKSKYVAVSTKDEFSDNDDDDDDDREHGRDTSWRVTIFKTIIWYMLGMHLWCRIATIGKNNVARRLQETSSSGGMITMVSLANQSESQENDSSEHDGSTTSLISDADLLHQSTNRHSTSAEDMEPPFEENELPQVDPPTIRDFVIAIGYMVFGMVALSAGLVSMFMESS